MHHFKILVTALVAMVFGCGSLICTAAVVEVRLPASVEKSAQDGRLLLIFAPASQSPEKEPRALVNWDGEAIPFFGVDVENWKPGTVRKVADEAFGFPVRKLADLPPAHQVRSNGSAEPAVHLKWRSFVARFSEQYGLCSESVS